MRPPDETIALEAAPPAAEAAGTALWVWQRLSGALLLVLVGLHLLVTHFLAPGEAPTFAAVSARLHRLLFVVVDVGLLAAVLFHALNGVRNVLLDFPLSRSGEAWVNRSLLALGIGAFAYGLFALLPFVGLTSGP